MKVPSFLLFCGLLFTSASYSQTDVAAWLTEAEINGVKLQILRIPEDKIPNGGTRTDIISAQRQMDKCRISYEKGQEADVRWLDAHIPFIKMHNTSFPVNYFIAEWDAYIAYNKTWKVKDVARRDARTKYIIDSFRIAQMTKDYRFINKEFVVVKEKPDAKSMTLGKIYHGSYVKAYNISDENFIEVDIAGMTGYILETDIAYTVKELEELDTPEEVIAKVKDHPFYRFEASAAYQARLDKEAAEEARALKAASSAPRRQYIRGPQGGCYYTNKNGNKEYVDKSFCQ